MAGLRKPPSEQSAPPAAPTSETTDRPIETCTALPHPRIQINNLETTANRVLTSDFEQETFASMIAVEDSGSTQRSNYEKNPILVWSIRRRFRDAAHGHWLAGHPRFSWLVMLVHT
jgi:hypothetical protein